MALILKQESAGSVTTPPSGKTAVFVDSSGQLGVKQPGGTTVVTGNITAVNLDGSSSNVLYGNGVFAPGGGGGGSYGNSNVATFLASFGSNTITTSGVISSTGNVNGGNINAGNMFVDGGTYLGPVGNITITGGSAGQVLRTNGSGVLTWVNQSGGGGGSPGGSDTQLQFNDAGSFGGIAEATYDGANLLIGNVTIGNVYYSDNILSPIPTYANTSYGNVIVHTPLVVNSPLSVLSADTSDTTLFTLSGAYTSGSQSGGTNNFGGYYPAGYVTFTWVQITSQDVTQVALDSIRIGDEVTCVGTNGYYTGSTTFRVTQVTKTQDLSFGANYYIEGVYVSGDVTSSFNANIFTCVRPYSVSTVIGGMSVDYVNAPEVVSTQMIVNNTLQVNKNAYMAAITETGPSQQSITQNIFGNTAITVVIYTSNYFTYYVSGTSSNPFDKIDMVAQLPEVQSGIREISFAFNMQNDMNVSMQSTSRISLYTPTLSFQGVTDIPVVWDSAPTIFPTGKTTVVTYKLQIMNFAYTQIFASYKTYG